MGAWWRGLLVRAIDGTLLAVPDGPANQAGFIKHRRNNGGAQYLALRPLVLVSCGTRTVLDAVLGPTADAETAYAPRLVRGPRTGMIVPLDRNFAAQNLVAAITQTGARGYWSGSRRAVGRPSWAAARTAPIRPGSALS